MRHSMCTGTASGPDSVPHWNSAASPYFPQSRLFPSIYITVVIIRYPLGLWPLAHPTFRFYGRYHNLPVAGILTGIWGGPKMKVP